MNKVLARVTHVLAASCLVLAFFCGPARGVTGAAPTEPGFPSFPAGQARAVELSIDEEGFADLSARERLEQVRDWLLLAVASDAGLSEAELNEAFFDLPPTRQGYMQPLSNFEYGAARSRYLGEGRVLALVPAGVGPAERLDLLAHIADEHRKNNDEVPATLYVFEYSVEGAQKLAQVTRRENIEGRQLFTPEAGYTEAVVATKADLQRFMGQVDDLTYTRLSGTTLTLGGRKIKGHGYRGIRVEDVAAIWQSEHKIAERQAAFEQRVKRVSDAFDAEWNLRGRQLIDQLNASGATLASAKGPIARFKAERERAGNALIERMAEERESLRLVNGSGFSLDPQYDYDELSKFYVETLEPLLRVYVVLQVVTDKDLSNARQGLARRDETPFLRLLAKIERDEQKLGADAGLATLLSQLTRMGFTFQAARYDGELQGTEVGMVLFYTDLLAKLWGFDYANSTPSRHITDFRAQTQIPVADIYRPEMDRLSSTRLWFGPQSKGFQAASSGPAKALLFGRNATRVFAASSNPLNPGAESAANASAGAFLQWWDDHYEEIARYEPEYERLNQIMKWSLAVSWLNDAQQGARLGFLADVPVDRSNWFPEWVKRRPDLRFTAWDQVKFQPRGYKGTKTEALSHVTSEEFKQFGKSYVLSGGVSLAGRGLFKARPVLSRVGGALRGAQATVAQRVGPRLLRSNLVYDTKASANALRTVEGTTYSVSRARVLPGGAAGATPPRLTVTAKAAPTARMRGVSSEIPSSLSVERSVVNTRQALSVETKIGDVPLGRLDIAKGENGLRVGWQSRDMDAGHALARRLSAAKQPDLLLKADPAVKSAYRLRNGEHLIELKGQGRWLRAAPAPQTAAIPPGWQSRVASPQSGSRGVVLKWVEPSAARAEARTVGAAVVKQPAAEGAARSLADDVASLDMLLAERQYTSALRLGEESVAAHGALPELQLRQGLAQLGRGRTQEAARLINAGGAGGPDRLRLLDEVGERAGGAFRVEGSTLHAEYRLPKLAAPDEASALGELPEGAKIAFVDDFASKRSYVYVADSPGLNNLDWSPAAAQRTMQQVISGELGTVVRLPRGSLGEFRPTVIFSADGKTAFRSVRQTRVNVGGGSNIGLLIPNSLDCRDDQSVDGDGCGAAGGDEQVIYLVIPAGR